MLNRLSIKASLNLLIFLLVTPFLVVLYLNLTNILKCNREIRVTLEKFNEIDTIAHRLDDKNLELHSLITKGVVMNDEHALFVSLDISKEVNNEFKKLKENAVLNDNSELQEKIEVLQDEYKKYIINVIRLSSTIIEQDSSEENAQRLVKIDEHKNIFYSHLKALLTGIDNFKKEIISFHIKNMERLINKGALEMFSVLLLSTILAALLLRYKVIKRMEIFLNHIKSLEKKEAVNEDFILEGSDELSLISQNFTYLLDSIEKNTKDMKEKEHLMLEQSKLAQMGEMLNMIAHQWRQPLNAISASAMNLSFQSELDTIDKESLEKTNSFIQKEVQNMSKIIDDFMEFNRAESNKDFFLFEAIDKTNEIVSPQLKSRSIVLEIDVNKKLKVFHNEKSIEHVLLNIITNARDAFEEHKNIKNKKIRIFATSKEGSITLHIEDNAGGIPKDIMNKLFNPYFTTKAQGKGTGIGLYMSKQMVESVSDSLLSAKNSDSGAIFTIRFKKKIS